MVVLSSVEINTHENRGTFDLLSQAVRDSGAIALPCDSRSVLVPRRLWDRLKDSSGTSKTQRKAAHIYSVPHDDLQSVART